jgi:hypothetical protein
MTEHPSPLIAEVEQYLSKEYWQQHQFLVPFFRRYYNVDLHSFKCFKTIKQDTAYYTLFISQENTMGMIAYDTRYRDLGMICTVPIVRLFNFLTCCLGDEEIANLEKAYLSGSINVVSERVSQLFNISFSEAEPMVSCLPKQDVVTLQVIKKILPSDG